MKNVNDYLRTAEKELLRVEPGMDQVDADVLVAAAQVCALMAIAAALRDA